jgi:hypothetical protein
MSTLITFEAATKIADGSDRRISAQTAAISDSGKVYFATVTGYQDGTITTELRVRSGAAFRTIREDHKLALRAAIAEAFRDGFGWMRSGGWKAIEAAPAELPPVSAYVPDETFIVNANHTVAKYAATDATARVSCRDGKYSAFMAVYGCSKDYATPEAAISGMLSDHGCTNIRVSRKPAATAPAELPAELPAAPAPVAEPAAPATAKPATVSVWRKFGRAVASVTQAATGAVAAFAVSATTAAMATALVTGESVVTLFGMVI